MGELGEITGVESQTKRYENAPFNERTTYVFRGIPYAHPVIDQEYLCNNYLLSIYVNRMATPHLVFILINREPWRCDFVLRYIVLGKLEATKFIDYICIQL